jgi:hypothetical protein
MKYMETDLLSFSSAVRKDARIDPAVDPAILDSIDSHPLEALAT